jgi:hypothetical protein
MKRRINNIQLKFYHLLFWIYWKFTAKKYRSIRNKTKTPRILFGPTPILNNKYWSNALKKNKWDSNSLSTIIPINCKSDDFDFYYNDILVTYPILTKILGKQANDYIILNYIIKRYDIICMSFGWTFLGNNPFWKKEAFLLKLFGIKTIIFPYGSDYWEYSRILDLSYKFGLMANYPDYGKTEYKIREKVQYWNEYADSVLLGGCVDGSSRNDCPIFSFLTIDETLWTPRQNYSLADGTNEVVKIVHTPNHRYIKGTEFLIDAVEELIQEGLKINLILIEKTPNERVREILCNEADILVEKLTYSVYGLSGLEGMAAGIAVVSNLEHEEITKAYRRYSFLNECPAVSGTPENIKDVLRILITKPELRKQLGMACRNYIEKYHTDKAFNHLLTNVIKNIWFGEKNELTGLFHPKNKLSFNNMYPLIIHPLKNNNLD